MFKKSFTYIIVVFLLLSGFTLSPVSSLDIVKSTSSGNTLYVGGTGDGNYTSIQDAIDDATDGDTVFVYSGVYPENLVVNKSITLEGENKISTIIYGNNGGDVIHISIDSVQISSFTIRNSGDLFGGAGIDATSHSSLISNIIITNNIIKNNAHGLYLSSSSNNLIFGNTIYNNYHGIYSEGSSNFNKIYHNNLFRNYISNSFDKAYNYWNTSYEGNYWGDYEGVDVDPEDGIGDTPYNIHGGDNKDYYPLMEPYDDEPSHIGPVENLDTGETFDTIQYAIDDGDTVSGHTIFVSSGTYFENLIVDKSITLQGEDKNNTFIIGDGAAKAADIVYISSNSVSLSNFTISSFTISGIFNYYSAGVRVYNYNGIKKCVIENNIISNNLEGIILENSFEYESNNIIKNNKIFNNRAAGLYITDGNKNNIIGNIISNNGHGIDVFRSDYNNITNNIICNNGGDFSSPIFGRSKLGGIELLISENNNISGNTMINDSISIWGWPSMGWEPWDSHIIEGNTVNGKPLYYLTDVNGFTIPPGAGQVILVNCTDVLVENQNLSDGSVGLQLVFSSNCSILNNTINNNKFGIDIYRSSGNQIISNILNNDEIGISKSSGKNNNISFNSMVNNGMLIQENSHNIIEGNTVNGKPLYYLTDVNGFTIPPGAGQVILVNCTDVLVENQNLSDGSVGLQLLSSNNCTIRNNKINDNKCGGIITEGSINNTLKCNEINNNCFSICMDHSHMNNITENNLSKNKQFGIIFYGSHLNKFIGNTIRDSKEGLRIEGSDNNTIYHNNFINNTNQAYEMACYSVDHWYKNYWDNGAQGGNYWDDYSGVDADGDGIGDAPYNITGSANAQDFYPLMEPWSDDPPDESEPKLQVLIDKAYGLLFENVSAEVINTGDAAAHNVNFTLFVEYGFLNNEKENSIESSNLEPDISKSVEVDEIRGFGPITVIATAYADDVESVSDEVSGFIIGPFILLSGGR
jgi:parallel beta-helix repeat protein